MVSLGLPSSGSALLRASPFTVRQARRPRLAVQANNRPLREYREDDGTVSNVGAEGSSKQQQQQQPDALYAEDNPPPPRDNMSPEMKARLRSEYYSLGGSPNKAMGGNYFLNIILAISLLAVLSKLFGYI